MSMVHQDKQLVVLILHLSVIKPLQERERSMLRLKKEKEEIDSPILNNRKRANNLKLSVIARISTQACFVH